MEPAVNPLSFAETGWNKPASLYKHYLAEQDKEKHLLLLPIQMRIALSELKLEIRLKEIPTTQIFYSYLQQ
jgi:hypothetical protein